MAQERGAACSLVHQELLRRYPFRDEEKGVLSAFLEARSRGVECLKGTELLTLVYGQVEPSQARVMQLLGRESTLRKLGLLICQGSSDKSDLRDRTFALSWSTLGELVSDEEALPGVEEGRPETPLQPLADIDSSTLRPYKSNREYLADQFERVRLYEKRRDLTFGRDYYPDPDLHTRKRSELKVVNDAIARLGREIEVRLAMTEQEFPLERWRRVYRLTETELLVILVTLAHRFRGGGRLYEFDILRWICRDEIEVMASRKVLWDDAPLFRHNILCTDRERFFGREIEVDETRLDELLAEGGDSKGPCRRESDRFAELEKRCSGKVFELIRPTVSLRDVVLPGPVRRQIGLILGSLEGQSQRTLRKWGVSTARIRPGRGSPGTGYSCTLLFSGEPGTGKTVTAEAVAHKLERAMLAVDCSTVLSCWVGTSQKNTRRIFREYEEVCKDLRPEPILFLDEVDQLFSMRTDIRQSADRMYNQMQNILLQSMDNFNGILIATTNLVENLDRAFSRRFQFKIEFTMPDAKPRLKLWELHLGDAPLAEEVDLGTLAQAHELSGAQIALSARNAALRASARRRKERVITQDDLESAIRAELSGSFGRSSKLPIGFRR